MRAFFGESNSVKYLRVTIRPWGSIRTFLVCCPTAFRDAKLFRLVFNVASPCLRLNVAWALTFGLKECELC